MNRISDRIKNAETFCRALSISRFLDFSAIPIGYSVVVIDERKEMDESLLCILELKYKIVKSD